MKILNCLVIFLLILSAETLHADRPAEKVRGLWVVRHNLNRPESIDSMLAFAARYHFTDLFVQVRGRGDAYYRSNYEPPAEGLEEGFDPLAYLLAKAKAADYSLRIHAWVNVFYLWSSPVLPKSPQHLVHRRPEWIVYPVHYNPEIPDTNFSGRRNEEGLYLSPMIPEVQQYILEVVEDLLSRYRVDGLHLDYIRFPGYDFDFNPVVRTSFKEKYFLDPLDFKRDAAVFVANFGNTGYDIFFNRWAKFLRSGLSGFVKSLSGQLRSRYPGIIISAAVKPDLSKAYWQYYQEWDRWLREKWLDWALPMNYTPANPEFLGRTETILKSGDPGGILMGISLYNQPPESVIYKTRVITNLDLSGFVYFSYDQIARDKKLQRLYANKILKPEKKP
ncbi:MAG: family 10 glycosylhydrolase [Calditrichaceae bacterium]|nr:family 10 glycosylhydrolase [Calditrichia bacterium]NUQ40434.1 family 10 glycosylhydrolase [Calditrichaceae bacterium]